MAESKGWFLENFEKESLKEDLELENLPEYFTLTASMNTDYISSFFNSLERLKPANLTPALFRDLMKLIHPHVGFPNMDSLL